MYNYVNCNRLWAITSKSDDDICRRTERLRYTNKKTNRNRKLCEIEEICQSSACDSIFYSEKDVDGSGALSAVSVNPLCWHRSASVTVADVNYYSVSRTRNSAIADEPRDPFVQTRWSDWPPKTRPSSYWSPCRILSFCVKGCRHTYRRTPKLDSALLVWEARLTPRYTIFPDMCYHVKFGSSVTK